MPRTKKRFIEEVDEAPQKESSSEEEDAAPVTTTVFPRSSFGGGKQFRPMGGGGKQIRTLPQSDDEENSEGDDSDAEESDVEPQQNIVYNGRPGVGKQFRPAMGGGKQLRYLQQQQEGSEEEKSESEDEAEEEEEEEESEPEPAVYAGAIRGGGKSLSHMRGMGKQLRRPPEDDEDSESSSESEDEAPQPIIPVNRVGGKSLSSMQRGGGKSLSSMQRGGGKQLRRPVDNDEDSESSDEEDEMEITDDKPNDEFNTMVDESKEVVDEMSAAVHTANQDMDVEDSNVNDASLNDVAPEAPSAVTEKEPSTEKNKSDDDMEESSEEEVEDEEEDEDSDDDSDEEEDNKELDMETLDENQLIRDEADKKYLDSLPEVERESILAERFEKLKEAEDMKRALRENKRREREKKRLAGGKKTQNRKENKGKQKQTTRTAVAKDSSGVSKDRELPDTSHDAEIASELALGRAAKNRDVSGVKAKKKAALDKLRQDRIDARKDEKEDSDYDYGDDDDDEDSDDEEEFRPWDMKKKKATRLEKMARDESDQSDDEDKSRANQVFMEADLDDFRLVTIPRRRLERWCDEPYFEKAVMGFYVRLAIGRDQRTQKPCYRLCKIVGIRAGTQYQFPQTGSTHEKPVSTNKWLLLKFGESTKLFKMYAISDSKPTGEDVTLCLNQMKNRRGGANDILSKKEAKRMRKMQDELVTNYVYTAEDIEKVISEKKNLSKTISNIAAEKTKAAIAVKAAETQLEEARSLENELQRKLLEVDSAEETLIEEELEQVKDRVKVLTDVLNKELENQKKVMEAEKLRRERLGKNQNWAKVNEKAKTANKVADIEAYKNEIAARRENTQNGTKDLFARRKVKPQILWEVGQKSDLQVDNNNNLQKGTVEEASRDDKNNKAKGWHESRERLNISSKKLSDQINELVIEEEALAAGLTGLNQKKLVTTRIRNGISLQEYLDRKAAGTL